MPTLTVPELLPDTVVHYSGEIRFPRSQGRVEALEWRNALMRVQHLLPPHEETTMLFRGMGLTPAEAAEVLKKDVETINTHSNSAFVSLGDAHTSVVALSRLFMPDYGPVLTVEEPLELDGPPDQELLRLVRFLSTAKNYDEARGQPHLSPDKVKRGIKKYAALLGMRNREELMFWANAARLLGPGEMVVKPPAAPSELPLWPPADSIPHEDFSIVPAAETREGVWHFPKSAKLPPDAGLEFAGGRLAKICAWGGRVAVNRQCELYKHLNEADINHLGTVTLGLTVEQSRVLPANPDITRRRFRRQFELGTYQPIYYAVHKAFQAGLLQVEKPADRTKPLIRAESLWHIVPQLLASPNQKTAADQLHITERALTYAVQRGCEQLGVSEFGGVVTYSYLAGRLAA